ncbi:hypothetical protein BO443_40458 [Burkholderia orbicola]
MSKFPYIFETGTDSKLDKYKS